jgi:hypothetical protein
MPRDLSRQMPLSVPTRQRGDLNQQARLYWGMLGYVLRLKRRQNHSRIRRMSGAVTCNSARGCTRGARCATTMGFRGSRVQIPPSRFLTRDATATYRCGVFAFRARGRVLVEFLRDSPVAQLSRLAHHREDALIIRLLVDLEEGIDVLPPSSESRRLVSSSRASCAD